MVKHRVLKAEEGRQVRGSIDYLLLVIIIMLSIFGIVMVFDSSIALLTNKYHFVILQSIWVGIGFALMGIFAFIDYKKLAKLALPGMLIIIFLLILVLGVGKDINGAIRWINLGAFQFQPSELAKPVYIIYLASWFAKTKPAFSNLEKKIQWSFFTEFLPFVFLTGFILLLVIAEKDLGTAVVIVTTAIGLFYIQGTGLLSLLSSLGSLGFFGLCALAAVLLEPYRLQRFLNFSGKSNNSLTNGYQINQILIAIGSGGLFGKGFTQSIQKQRYLVETTAATDSIFAVIAEEFGFIGSLVLIAGYMFLFYRCIRIAIKSQDALARYMAIGITLWICTQTMLNIAVNVALVPLTGIPLPFISYGGSSTIILLASIGVLLNISRYISHEKKQR